MSKKQTAGGPQLSYWKVYRALIGEPYFIDPVQAHKLLLKALPEKQRSRLRK
jgi:hypothetical protein